MGKVWEVSRRIVLTDDSDITQHHREAGRLSRIAELTELFVNVNASCDSYLGRVVGNRGLCPALLLESPRCLQGQRRGI